MLEGLPGQQVAAIQAKIWAAFAPDASRRWVLEALSFFSFDYDKLDYQFEIDPEPPYQADFNLFWLLNHMLEYLDIPRRIAFIPKGYDYHDTWTDLMLITPSVYDKAVDLGVFPWMDVNPFYSERIVWSDQPS